MVSLIMSWLIYIEQIHRMNNLILIDVSRIVNAMQNVIRADDIKPDFEGLKNKWEEMLQKYYIDANMLDPKYTLEIPCPHCGSEHTDNEFFLNGFFHFFL